MFSKNPIINKIDKKFLLLFNIKWIFEIIIWILSNWHDLHDKSNMFNNKCIWKFNVSKVLSEFLLFIDIINDSWLNIIFLNNNSKKIRFVVFKEYSKRTYAK